MAKEHMLNFIIGSKLSSSFTPNISKVSKEFNSLNTDLEKFNKTQEDINKFAGLKNSLKQDKEKAALLQSEINKMATEIKNTEKPTKTLTTAFEMKRKELSQLHDKIDKNSISLQEYRTSLKDAGINTKNLAEESIKLKESFKEQMRQQGLMNSVADKQERFEILRQKRAEARLQRLSKLEEEKEAKRKKFNENIGKTQDYGNNLKDSGEKQAKKGAVQAGIITMGVKLAIDDENAFADVKKTTGFAGAEAAKFRKEIINATKDIPLMNDEIYNIASAAGQAGIAQKEMIRFTKEASIAAVAFDQNAMDAGKTLATWRTGFGLTQDQVMKLGDQVNYLANNTNATAVDVSDIINRVGAIGKNAGFSIEQVGALGATLVSMGQAPELASTAIKNMTGALTKSYAVTKSQAGAYAILGLDAEKVAKAMQTDASGTMFMVLEKINKINVADKGALISQLFGEEAKTGVSQLAASIPELKKNLDMVADSTKYTGSMMAEYESRSATTENSLILLAKSSQTVASNMAYAFLPTIQSGSKELISIAQEIGSFSDKHPTLSRNIGYTVAGLAAFNITMGVSKILLGNTITQGAKLIGFFTAKTVAVTADTVATGANTVAENTLYVSRFRSTIMTGKNIAMAGAHKIAMLGSKSATVGAMIAQNGLNLALINNPIGWTIGALVAVGVAFTVAYKKSEPFRNMIDGIIEKGKKLAKVFGFFDNDKKININTETTDNILKLKEHANGGVSNKPAIFGEAGPEIAIPLKTTNRSKSLLAYANRAINGEGGSSSSPLSYVNNNSNSQSSGQVIQISMPITIQNAGGSEQEAKKYGETVSKTAFENLDSLLKRKTLDKGRLNLG